MKRNNWFNNYQHDKELSRFNKLKKEDFYKQSVLDIGCNSGQLSRYLIDIGARKVLGIDFDNGAVAGARHLSKDYKNITYLTDDIDNYMLYTNLDFYDCGIIYSVIGTKELENRYGMLSKVSRKILKTMYITGHHRVFKKDELFESIIKYTDFTSIEYLGEIYDKETDKKSRSIFRCTREIYNKQTFFDKILSLLSGDSKLIAIQGHGGVGKSSLKLKLIDYLNINNYKMLSKDGKHHYVSDNNLVYIMDDVKSPNIKELKRKYKYIIFFDYRVLEYLSGHDIHTLFIHNYDINSRFKNRPQMQHHRSVSIENFVSNIYHINEYNKIEYNINEYNKIECNKNEYNINEYNKIECKKNEKLTVLITTHYTERQRLCLDITLKYLLQHFSGEENYEILICNDSYNKSASHITKAEENMKFLRSKYNFNWYHGKREFKFNNKVYNFKTVGCNILDLITKCNTDYFLFLEHDWMFTKKINVNNLLDLFELNKEINYIRFSWSREPGRWDKKTKYIEELDLTSTNGFTNHPYISRRQFWNDFLIDKLISNEVKFIEDCMQKHMETERNKMGLYIYKKLIYNNSSDDSVCIKHLDGSNNYDEGQPRAKRSTSLAKSMKDEDLIKLSADVQGPNEQFEQMDCDALSADDALRYEAGRAFAHD